MNDASADITELLLAVNNGDRQAFEHMLPVVYAELQAIARQRLRGFRRGDTLDTVALVHETYLKLVDQTRIAWKDRGHFFAVASRSMRFVLVDYARAQSAAKRGGHGRPLSLDDESAADRSIAADRADELLAVDRALNRLETVSPRLAKVVEHKFFGGLTHEEIGEVLACSPATVKRDWRRARAWLYELMVDGTSGSETK